MPENYQNCPWWLCEIFYKSFVLAVAINSGLLVVRMSILDNQWKIFFSALYLLHIFAPKHYVRRNVFWNVTTEPHLQHVWKYHGGKRKVGCSQMNVSSTTVSSRNIQTFDMIDCDMRNRGDTSTGMTFQLLHLFLLNIFIIQNKVILGLFLILTIFLCICT